jgi:hypothetical protein
LNGWATGPGAALEKGGAMRHEWIVEVLTDMGRFADKNDLPALAAQIEVALMVAKVELNAPPMQVSGQPDAASNKH